MSYGHGRRDGRGRYRWMQNTTGLPGWMRFGFSPGGLGISPSGLPPTEQCTISQTLFQPSSFSADQEKQILTQQLETIRKRIVELEQEE